MRTELNRSLVEKYRPFFWVDAAFRVSGWPDATARALRVPARSAVGRHCWDVVFHCKRDTPPDYCLRCQCHNAPESADGAKPGNSRQRCAVLPLANGTLGAIVWLPFPLIANGATGSARLEGLVIRGALADSLGSIHATLDSLRRICAADDCEMFLLDSAAKEVFLVDCVGRDRDAFLEKTHMPLGAGYPGAVTLHQKPFFTNRFQKDRLFLRSSVKRCGIRSFIGVPLMDGGRPLGYIGVGWRDAGVPMAWGLRVLEEVRNILPVAVPPRLVPPQLIHAPAARLALRCFGPLKIFCDGEKIPVDAFKRRKALRLLKTLVLMRGTPIHRDRLIELLWPDCSQPAAVNRLHGVVNALRSSLESRRRPRTSEYIVCRDDFFHFNTDAPHSIDLFDFCDAEALARNALRQGEQERALDLLEKAVQLYRGDLFADDSEDETIEAQRVRLRHVYLDAVRELARLRTHLGHADEAIRVLRTALDIEPVAVDLYEALISQLLHLGRQAEARQQYEFGCAALRKYLDMEPPARMRALEKQLY
ncbi:MAG: GAF domain-containing protein [Rhodocyclaceae bacterium]|nr:GAF domain-containing protein [Rhodocyclaceae bacterium]